MFFIDYDHCLMDLGSCFLGVGIHAGRKRQLVDEDNLKMARVKL